MSHRPGISDVMPDPDDLIREGYAREAALLARCDKAEAEVKRLREDSEEAMMDALSLMPPVIARQFRNTLSYKRLADRLRHV